MKLSRRSFLYRSAFASAAFVAAPAVIRQGAIASDAIRLGSLHDQSGPLAASGVSMVHALNLAVEEINAGGGLLGRPVEVVHYDTQSNMQLYSQYAQQLALKDKVAVVHGGITSASREAIRPTFDRFKVPYFYNVLYEGGVCDRNTICTGTTPAQTVEKLVPAAMKTSGKKVYVIAADYNYGQITAKWMTKYVKDNGGEVLSVDFFPLDVTNFGPTISKIQAAKPDLVLSALVGGNHTSFYRQWASTGMQGQIPIASTTFGLANEPASLDAVESDNVLGAYGYFEELDTPASRAFVRKIRAAHPDAPYISELVATTYEGVHLWAEAVKKAGSLDRQNLLEALESGLSIDGPSGKVAIDKSTHHTVRNAFMAKMKDKKWSVLESYPEVAPSDTASVCDLVRNPNDTRQYVINL